MKVVCGAARNGCSAIMIFAFNADNKKEENYGTNSIK
jgi:hypothetical protein